MAYNTKGLYGIALIFKEQVPMERNILWSLRLGFDRRLALALQEYGLRHCIETSFKSKTDESIPEFLNDVPKNLEQLKAFRKKLKNAPVEEKRQVQKAQRQIMVQLNHWWLQKMLTDTSSLHQKMVLFWQNHFVVTAQKVKNPYHIYQYHSMLEKHAFGNFKQLTKLVVKSNAMIRYLDNHDNRKGKINENLSRELLELFTLGIGNYTEQDVKNGAKALCGLGFGDEFGQYRPKFMMNGPKRYLGKTGNFKANDLVDIIFEQDAAPYFVTKKILQWFIYDDPKDELVKYYGDYFREKDFAIKPLLQKIFLEEYEKDTGGSKIKDPLTFAFQTLYELNMTNVTPAHIATFLQSQGMQFYGQRNVKGWPGGQSWLTSHAYLERQKVADQLCRGQLPSKRKKKAGQKAKPNKIPVINLADTVTNRKETIDALSQRLLFKTDIVLKKDMEEILKNDFRPGNENAQRALLRLFNHMIKLPEYQLI